MRSISVPVLLFATLQITAVTQQKPPVAVTITTPTPVAKSGEPIRIDVSVRNTSDQTVRIWKARGPDGQAELVDTVQVYDAQGKPAAWTAGRHTALSTKQIELDPGKSADDFLILTKLYDLSKPGRYTVLVRHGFTRLDAENPADRRLLVPSNLLIIRVGE